ncbi:HAMP domain-containing sensor histidine kinase [Bacteroides thetaiotaomicron]|jgi:hypothetical protein|uniref:sensor histidine kinase n=1 Tax=Bacteroides thetaiotaomicron TaxID=818 RepID=UPI00189F2FD9|nr:HAMP domain-containing sensor histidine kinase [Bacteroides thetaiotaomicron]MDC2175207.1 HAMP domain-containing sensor histidine kinase [Bacteroides thetaiotaomicron]MDC2190797.1 HAMP domain-containing sensor histidine kinase [Bacteroides thetaiotaomicron]
MKIRTRLTLGYLCATALLVIFVFFILEEMLFPQDGYDMLHILNIKLLLIWLLSFAILFMIGYFMARSALNPVSHIIRQMKKTTASDLSQRVSVNNQKDEIGELALTFNKTLDRLEESFESQKMFVSNVSHELRTPMAALIAELELALHKERSNEEYKQVVEAALNDARKVEKLSGGLLDLAKVSYDKGQIAMNEVRLDEVLIDAFAIVLKANPDYKVDMISDDTNDDDTLITVLGNEYLLRTAFANLIENNCKFSPDKSSVIQIIVNGHLVNIQFSDKGIGIPQEDIDQLFTPFYRGRNKYYIGGNGIGMALVDKIISLHSGEIHIQSQPGIGTQFTISLSHK